jgi:hypothetical protein
MRVEVLSCFIKALTDKQNRQSRVLVEVLSCFIKALTDKQNRQSRVFGSIKWGSDKRYVAAENGTNLRDKVALAMASGGICTLIEHLLLEIDGAKDGRGENTRKAFMLTDLPGREFVAVQSLHVTSRVDCMTCASLNNLCFEWNPPIVQALSLFQFWA